MKTRMKRLISLLCVITVFVSTVLSTNFLSAKAETESGQVETLPTDMTEITFEDFGIADNTYSRTFSATYDGQTMENTLFSGKIKFSATGETHFMYGGTRTSAGFILTNVFDEENEQYYLRLYDSNADKNNGGKIKFNDKYFYADEAGVDTFVDIEFKLNYTMEYVNNDNGTKNNDLKLGVWFNGKLYQNKYIYINDYVDNGHSIGNYITVWTRFNATIELKSCNYQLPTDMTKITFDNFGFDDGDYTASKKGQYDGETLDGTLFSGKITFSETGDTHLIYGGKVAGGGISLATSYDNTHGYHLRLRNPKGSESTATFSEIHFYSEKAEVPLVGQELELNITTEYVDNDGKGSKNDLKIGVWFGGKLYEDQYIYVNDYVDNSHSMGTWMYLAIMSGATTNIKSVREIDWKPLPTDMEEISFRDFGFVDGDYTTSKKGQYEGDTLNGTLFSGKITFSETGDTHLIYGGKVAGGGISLATSHDDTHGYHLRLRNPKGSESTATFSEIHFYSDVARVPLVGEELDLKLSLRYIDNDGKGSENDVELGVWFGGKLYNNTYIYINDYVDNSHSMGTWMSFAIMGGATTKIESVGEINWKPLPTDMKEISFRDFGFVDGDYTSSKKGQYDGDTLNGTLFSGKITFSETGDTHLIYGGKVAGGGISLATSYDDTHGYHLRLRNPKDSESTATFSEIHFYSDVARVPLVGEELDLKLSLQYIDNDGKGAENDVKLGVWFGGKLYNNNYIYINDYVDNNHSMGTWMSFAIMGGATTKIESVGEINWKPLPTGMKEITFRDFGFIDGDYTSSKKGQYDGDTLDGTLFSGKITFSETGDTHLLYGGKVAGGGLELAIGTDPTGKATHLRLRNPKGSESTATFNEIKFYSDVAGVQLVGEELDLKLSLQYIDNDGKGVKNDVKLGVWFDGKLYNNNYIYINDYVDNSHSMGTWMSFAITGGAKTTIKSVGTINWKDVPEGLTEITFRDFGFIDGDYSKYTKGQYDGETLDNTMFIGKITFPEVANVFLQYGGKEASGGFNLGTAQDAKTGEWYLRLFDTHKVKNETTFTEHRLYSNVADVEALVGKEIALGMSLQYVDHDGDGMKDDVKLGVWFNGKLYNNNYIYMNDYADTAHCMGTWMSFYFKETTNLHIESVGEIDWKPLPTGFTEIGFSDYGVASGSYEGGTKKGFCELESMDKTLFSGVVTYSKEGETHFIYGGTVSMGGFDLVNVYDKKTGEHYLRLFDTDKDKTGKKFNDMYFYSDVARVTLVGEELDLKYSLEYVDHDGDGAADDLKLGVWFGGKLYNNRYIYIDNYVNNGHSIGNCLTIWVRNEAVFNVGRISEWLNWSAFGLTANWKKTLLDTDFNLTYTLAGGNPYTGDDAKLPYLAMFVSCAVVVLYGTRLVRKGRRKNEIC